MDRNEDVITFILKYFNFYFHFQSCLLKKPLIIQKNLKELEIMYQNAIYIRIS